MRMTCDLCLNNYINWKIITCETCGEQFCLKCFNKYLKNRYEYKEYLHENSIDIIEIEKCLVCDNEEIIEKLKYIGDIIRLYRIFLERFEITDEMLLS